MSTRNTKPSSLRTSSSRMSSRPSRLKYSSFSMTRGPSVWPRLGEQEHQVDVGGEIQLAPAELAHAQHDQRRLLTVHCRAACRKSAPRCNCAAAAAARMHPSAKSESACNVATTSATAPAPAPAPARPAMSRHAMRSISRRRHSRRMRWASAVVACPSGLGFVCGAGLAARRGRLVEREPSERLRVLNQHRTGELACGDDTRQFRPQRFAQRRIGIDENRLRAGALPPTRQWLAQDLGNGCKVHDVPNEQPP